MTALDLGKTLILLALGITSLFFVVGAFDELEKAVTAALPWGDSFLGAALFRAWFGALMALYILAVGAAMLLAAPGLAGVFKCKTGFCEVAKGTIPSRHPYQKSSQGPEAVAMTNFDAPRETAAVPPPAAALTHLDEQGRARMVDVGGKPVTDREAVARGSVLMQRDTLNLIQQGLVKKGDVLTIAQLAGIMGAKRTSELIPLCHPLPLSKVDVELELDAAQSRVNLTATARTSGQTGVEMEALTAVTIAALTVYDMCKAVDRGMRIDAVRLVRKRGGQSGDLTLE